MSVGAPSGAPEASPPSERHVVGGRSWDAIYQEGEGRQLNTEDHTLPASVKTDDRTSTAAGHQDLVPVSVANGTSLETVSIEA